MVYYSSRAWMGSNRWNTTALYLDLLNQFRMAQMCLDEFNGIFNQTNCLICCKVSPLVYSTFPWQHFQKCIIDYTFFICVYMACIILTSPDARHCWASSCAWSIVLAWIEPATVPYPSHTTAVNVLQHCVPPPSPPAAVPAPEFLQSVCMDVLLLSVAQYLCQWM